MPKSKLHKVICQEWEESERGWGVRPDGYTLHLTRADRVSYVAKFYAENNNAAVAPDEYTRVSGDPFEVEVGPKTFKGLTAAKKKGELGIWGDGNHYPRTKGKVVREETVPDTLP